MNVPQRPAGQSLCGADAASVRLKPPGCDIFSHGQPNVLLDGQMIKGDRTAGCTAVATAEIREIWYVTPCGTKAGIRP